MEAEPRAGQTSRFSSHERTHAAIQGQAEDLGAPLAQTQSERAFHERTAMNDQQLLQHISRLVDEESRLRAEGPGEAGPSAENLRRIEEALDQCWDLLRQRRARREFGDAPDAASLRSVDTVERYEN